MRTEQLSPLFTVWKPGKTHRAHAWSAADSSLGGTQVRDIYHYSTRMGTFTSHGDQWEFHPISVGCGSVSDAQGMNKITRGYGVRMYRDQRGGGPRWETDAEHQHRQEQAALPKPRRVRPKPPPDKVVIKVLKRAVPA